MEADRAKAEMIAPQALIEHVGNYVRLLNDKESALSAEERQEVAGLYYGEYVVGQYTDLQISAAFWMHGL